MEGSDTDSPQALARPLKGNRVVFPIVGVLFLGLGIFNLANPRMITLLGVLFLGVGVLQLWVGYLTNTRNLIELYTDRVVFREAPVKSQKSFSFTDIQRLEEENEKKVWLHVRDPESGTDKRYILPFAGIAKDERDTILKMLREKVGTSENA